MELLPDFQRELTAKEVRIALTKIALVAGETSGALSVLMKNGLAEAVAAEFGETFVENLYLGSDRMLELVGELIGPTDQSQGDANG